MLVIAPTVELAFWTGLVIAALLIAVAVITMTESVYQRIKDRRRESVRSDIRHGILKRMSSQDPDWTGWVAGLSDVERKVARTELDEYLRNTKGEEKDRLIGLGEALDIPTTAHKTLRDGKRHEKLQALIWLALLEKSAEINTLQNACIEDNDLRAAGARVLYEADHPDARSVGTELLLGDGDLTLSVYGLDTLYQLYRTNPRPLFERASAEYSTWRPSLIIQVLNVLRHCGSSGRDAPKEWIIELTEHELPAVRAAAALALEPEGWRTDLREQVNVDNLIGDPAPAMREAVYQMLGEWGDASAHASLVNGAEADSDQRARVQALEPLADRPELASPQAINNDEEDYNRAWQWVQAKNRLDTDR